MELLPPRLQQARVGRVLNERVLEHIGRVRRRTAAEDELGPGQLVERITQVTLFLAGDPTQQLIGELPSNGRTDLRDFLYRSQAVEACHQGILQ